MLELALESEFFSPEVSRFDKENLVPALQLVLVELGENSERKFNEFTNDDLTMRLTEALYKLEQTLISAVATDQDPREGLENGRRYSIRIPSEAGTRRRSPKTF